MSGDIDLEQLEQQAQAEAIQSIKVRNLPQVGPPPIGRWTNIGIGWRAVMDVLGLSGEEAAAILGEHLGKTIPYRFASWSVAASIKIDGFAAQPMINFGAREGSPEFAPGIFRSLFFWGDEVDHLQWSTGTFGGMTGARWHIALSGQALTLHAFTVHGTVIDELALHRALGLPHDEKVLAIDPAAVAAPSAPDKAMTSGRRRTRTTGFGLYDAPFVDEIVRRRAAGEFPSHTAAAWAVLKEKRAAGTPVQGQSDDAIIRRWERRAGAVETDGACRIAADSIRFSP